MERFGIVTSYTPSLMAVADDIAHALGRLGYHPLAIHRQVSPHDAKRMFDRALVFIPFDPLYAPSWFLLQRDYALMGIPSFVYTTVEGSPKRHLVRSWFSRDCSFVAVSRFAEQMLSRVGIRCRAVVHHGVNTELVEQVREEARARKERIKRLKGIDCLFGTVASSHKRKALDLLAKAIEYVQNNLQGCGFYILTNPQGERFFAGLRDVYVSKEFGKLTRREVLGIIGSFDFYVHPALTEGFGLPILESHAFGIPSIYPEYAPITEFSPTSLNYTCMVTEEEWQDFGDGIIYLCRYFRPEEMAKRIAEAYCDYRDRRSEYEDRGEKLREHAKKFDILHTYARFVK